MTFIIQMLAWFLLLVMSRQMTTTTAARVPEPLSLRLCGSDLADALDLICGSNFYFDMNKASEPDKSMPVLTKPFFKLNRYKRGVSSECCRSVNGCKIETLKSYCLAPSPRYVNALYWFMYQRDNLGRQLRTTEKPKPPVPASTSRPFVTKSSKKIYRSYFYVQTGPRPTRVPLF